jgi:hypothetical protein
MKKYLKNIVCFCGFVDFTLFLVFVFLMLRFFTNTQL